MENRGILHGACNANLSYAKITTVAQPISGRMSTLIFIILLLISSTGSSLRARDTHAPAHQTSLAG